MSTIDHVFTWDIYQINIALTLLYEWMVKTKMKGDDLPLCCVGSTFEAFIYLTACDLFDTKDDSVVTRELCKRFGLNFESVTSFDILIQHFAIWGGHHLIYGEETFRLPSQFLTPFYQNDRIFL